MPAPAHPMFIRFGIASAAAGLIVALADPAFAQASGAGGALDTAIENMANTLERIGDTLGQRAQQILLGFLLIEFVWRGGKWVIQGQGLDEFAQPMVYTIGIVSLVWLFATLVPEIVGWLASTAVDIAGSVDGSSVVTPSDLVTEGFSRATSWLGEVRLRQPSTYFYVIATIVAIIVLALQVAMVVVIYAELYLVGLAGIITLGFAGLSETRQIATSYVLMLVGKGFRLMGLLIIINATQEITLTLARADGTGPETVMAVLLLQIVSVILVLTLPSTLERLIAGPASGASASEAVGAKVGSTATTAATAGVAATGGAVVGGATGAFAAKGTGAINVASSMVQSAGETSLNWGTIAARGQTGSAIMDHIRSRGRGGRE